jgi:hypothetical protein
MQVRNWAVVDGRRQLQLIVVQACGDERDQREGNAEVGVCAAQEVRRCEAADGAVGRWYGLEEGTGLG